MNIWISSYKKKVRKIICLDLYPPLFIVESIIPSDYGSGINSSHQFQSDATGQVSIKIDYCWGIECWIPETTISIHQDENILNTFQIYIFGGEENLAKSMNSSPSKRMIIRGSGLHFEIASFEERSKDSCKKGLKFILNSEMIRSGYGD